MVRDASPPPPHEPHLSAELLPVQTCNGLRAHAVSSSACEGFQLICRVVDTAFSHVSAEVLFELRAFAPDARAVQAFDLLVGPEAARLFEQAVGLQLKSGQLEGAFCKDFGDVAMTYAALATQHRH